MKEEINQEVNFDPDEPKITRFFTEIISNYPLVKGRQKFAFILVNHVVPTLPHFIDAISKLGRIGMLIPKGSHHDEKILRRVSQQIEDSLVTVSRDDLTKSGKAIELIKEKIREDEEFVIIDIGGYFAPCLKEISTDQILQGRFLGIVEDTENGHQAYENPAKEVEHPVISVARSRLKNTEDYNVGKSIVRAADTILRQSAHTYTERMKTAVVLGFGKIGRSIAIHLRDMGVKKVKIYDTNPIILMEASSLGFDVVTTEQREALLGKADLIFCATGQKSLNDKDFKLFKHNVFIASCTSADNELDFEDLKKQFSSSIGHLYSYTWDSKRVYLMHNGNAVNFPFNAVNGPFIYSVQAELIVSAIKLQRREIHFNKRKILEFVNNDIEKIDDDANKIATIWLSHFESRKKPLSVWNVPDKNPSFTGRENELQQLSNKLLKTSNCVIAQTIKGLPGIGKSQLAKAYVYVHKDDYQLIWWFDFSNDVVSQFRCLGEQICKAKEREVLQTGYIPQIDENDDEGKVIAEIHNTLRQTKKWLLIFDNAEMNNQIQKYIPQQSASSYGHIIITSQTLIRGSEPLVLNCFERLVSIKYIQQAKLSNIDDKDINKLAEILCDYPLAITQALSYLKKYTLVNSSQYIEDFHLKYLNKGEIYSTDIEDNYKYTLKITLNMLVDRLKPIEKKLLQLITLFHPESIPYELIQFLFNQLVSGEIDLDEILSELCNLNILYKDQDNFSIHRLVRLIVIASIAEEGKREIVSKGLAALNTVFTDKRIDLNIKYNIYYSHLKEIVMDLTSVSPDNMETFIHVLLHLTRACLSLRQAKAAIGYAKKAHDLFIDFSAEDAELQFQILVELALSHLVTGSYEDSKKYLLEAKEIASGMSVTKKIEILHYLVKYYYSCRLPNLKAIEYAEEAVSLSETLDDKSKAKAQKKLAQAYRVNREYTEAVHALELARKYSGESGHEINEIDLKIAEVCIDQKEYENALQKSQSIFPIYLKELGEEHPTIRKIMVQIIAVCFRELQQIDQGVQFFGQYCQSESPKFLITLAQCYHNLKYTEKAIEIYRKALDIKLKQVNNENDIDLSIIYSSLGFHLGENPNEFEEATKFTKKALSIKECIDGEESTIVATECRNLARIYLRSTSFHKFEREIFELLERAKKIGDQRSKYKVSQRNTTLSLLIEACENFEKEQELTHYQKEKEALKYLQEQGKQKSGIKREESEINKDTVLAATQMGQFQPKKQKLTSSKKPITMPVDKENLPFNRPNEFKQRRN